MCRIGAFTTLLLSFVACSGSETHSGNNSPCAEGYRSEEQACLPIFDDCPAPNEIPVRGGGCLQVGVTQCATGFESDGAGGCAPILPAAECPPGTLAILGETACQPVGVEQCSPGFASDGAGGCAPILPEGVCPPDTLAVLGEATCQPIDTCGTGIWGNIQPDGSTLYVDGATGNDAWPGTDASPLATVSQALVLVADDGQIAVAAGDYAERLTLSRPVRLRGRCSSLVTLRGVRFLGNDVPPVSIVDGADGSVLSGVTLTGDAEGLVLRAATGVLVEEVQIVEPVRYGVRADYEAEGLLRRVVISGAKRCGVYQTGASLAFEQADIRRTQTDDDSSFGRGVSVECSSVTGACGSFSITGSVLTENTESSIYSSGVELTVADSVIRDTQLSPWNNRSARGIHSSCNNDGECGPLTVSGSVIANNGELGVAINGTDVDITQTTIRDTWSSAAQAMGWGIGTECHQLSGQCGALHVGNSRIAGNTELGVSTAGYETRLESTIIEATLPAAEADTFGLGVNAVCSLYVPDCGSLTFERSLVQNNRSAGVALSGPPGVFTGTTVRGTQPRVSDDIAGYGIEAICDPSAGDCAPLHISGSVISDNHYSGIVVSGGDVTVTASLVERTREHVNDNGHRAGHGLLVQCHDQFTCPRPAVQGCVFRECVGSGISVGGVDLLVEDTVVQDTFARSVDEQSGLGIGGTCDPGLMLCGSLTVRRSVITRSSYIGILGLGLPMEITGTIVRDTQRRPDGSRGLGVSAQCEWHSRFCGSLTMSESLVVGNAERGISLIGSEAWLDNILVTDTLPRLKDDPAGTYAVGIVATCDAGLATCSRLELTSSVIRSSVSVGVSTYGSTGVIEGCLITGVASQPGDGAHGYGILAQAEPGAPPATLTVLNTEVRDAELAGVLFSSAGGSIDRSKVWGSSFSVVMNPGSTVVVSEDNVFVGNLEDEPTWTTMDPTPAPDPLLPGSIFQ
ncbi:MAG: right-handed parallel beta-helix repeat-containing protein [bacterium]